MKAFCLECGAETGEGKDAPRCKLHPDSKLVLETWYKKQFDAIRSLCDAATGVGRVTRCGVGAYWSTLESRARKAGAM